MGESGGGGGEGDRWMKDFGIGGKKKVIGRGRNPPFHRHGLTNVFWGFQVGSNSGNDAEGGGNDE